MGERTWTISNTISVSRVLLIAPLGYCLFSDFDGSRSWAVLIIIVGILTDFLDGLLARRLHEVSEIGKIVDPLADKIAIGLLALFLLIAGDIPLWYFVVIVVRDVLILAGGIYIRRTKNIVAQSNWPGKIAVSAIAFVLLLSVLRDPRVEGLKIVMLWTSMLFMTFSLVVYTQRLFIGRGVERKP